MGRKRKNQTFGKVKRKSVAAIIKKKKQMEMCNVDLTTPKPNRKAAFRPKTLAFLCKRVIIKYKLQPEKKKFTTPETFSVVGGKPLRKRSVKPPPAKKEKKGKNPESLVALCQIVIQEYNLLPQCEETEQPASNQLLIKKNAPSRKRGRPRKPESTKPIRETKQKKRGRPRKDQIASNEYGEPSINYSTFLAQSQDIRNIKVEQDLFLDRPPEDDPLQQGEDEYTILIKEEPIDIEHDELAGRVPITIDVPQATAQGIVINPMAQVEVPGPYGRITEPKNMTVVMDEYQIFANSVAEQLRALPPNRALLLQLDIQSMIDNEKQLIGHES
ncbi:uncharacterized protein LOC133533632 isoform X2 [Cydia pomonella]|uniref:uncharacterized protein LOC133533632 isoform X2 n=1 Tax=Cydia pomonella TaxID=82600 RepID=UPI002ADDEA02|nr:uncharacterized protein LOC133533632 isoform X2 [Cydia pomonella]